MKKIVNYLLFDRRKLYWIMVRVKLICLVLMFGISSLNAKVWSQQEKMSINLKNTGFEKFFEHVQKKTNVRFVFNHEDMLGYSFDVKAKNEVVVDILDKVFKGKPFRYEVINNLVVVFYDKSNLKKEQQKLITIKGKVTDKDGNTLPGVSIFVKGTNTGVATDINGVYELKIADKKSSVLVFSFVGMTSKEIVYKGQSVINVVLVPDTKNLEEVVVTGYQTISKERTTGSFSIIDNEDFEQRITTNITERLEGLVPGLYVDGDKNITIRGVGTIYGDSKPLLVVDGFPVESDLSTINPEDIKSITVLKDAAATSVWGVKAANGVIVVTTKMGTKKGKAEVNASYYLTIEKKPSFSDLNLISSADLIDYELETYDAGNWSPIYASILPQSPTNPLQRVYLDKYRGTITQQEYDSRIAELGKVDAYKQMEKYFYQNAMSHQFNVSINGGTEKGRYYASLSYNGNEASSVGNTSDRLNINLKNDYILSEKIVLSSSVNLTYSESSNNAVGEYELSFHKPYQTIVDDSGIPVQYYMVVDEKGKELEDKGYLSYTRSLIDVLNNNDNTTKGFDARLQIGLNYKILPELDFDTKFQYERGYYKTRDLKSVKHPETRRMINTYAIEDGMGGLNFQLPKGAWLKTSNNDHEAWTWRNQLSYNASFNEEKHQIAAIAGTEIRKYVTYGFSDEKFGYDEKTMTYSPMDEKAWLSTMQYAAWYGRTGMGYPSFSKFSEIDNRDVSFFVNGSYTYDSKYTLTASARVDQSNLFGSSSEFRYKPLWSAGLKWKISDEEFFKEIKWVDNLVVRATYGVGGNTNKNFYPTLMGIKDVSYGTGNSFINLTNPANDKLKWESAYMFNVGVDWSVLSNRIWGGFDFYNKDSKDIVGRQTMDATYGWDAANVNFASINNKGVELSVNANPLKTKDFVWESNFNIAYNKNKVVEVGVVGATTTNYLEDLPELELFEYYSQYGMMGYVGFPIVGKPMSRVYAYKWGGLDSSGQPQVYNENNELVSWNDFSGDPAALKYMGSATPTVFGNLKNSFSYKGITIAVNMSYKFGHVFRAPRSTDSQVFGVLLDDLADRWRQSGDEKTTDVPVYSRTLGYYMNEYYSKADINVLSGDLIRLSDIALDYNIPETIISKTPFSSLNVKFQARNLWLWTANDEGIDPDKHMSFPNYLTFPTPKSFVIGIKATF